MIIINYYHNHHHHHHQKKNNNNYQKQLPWSEAKGFDTFCPISGFIEKSLISDPQNVELKLTIDGEVKQHGNTSDMIFSIPKLLEYCSSKMTLEVGDLLLTGTPPVCFSYHYYHRHYCCLYFSYRFNM